MSIFLKSYPSFSTSFSDICETTKVAVSFLSCLSQSVPKLMHKVTLLNLLYS